MYGALGITGCSHVIPQLVNDINRVAAVVQVVAKVGDTIYGKCLAFGVKVWLIKCIEYTTCTAASDSRKNGIAAGY